MNGGYASVRFEDVHQTKVEGSRFIAGLFPVETDDEAKEKLERVRKLHYDATHHCFAYVIGADFKNVRYSDDGEPSGTAGLKILAALQSRKLSDVLCVVTRYFGGTKLGTGGLSRAYFDSTLAVIDQSVIITKTVAQELHIVYPFSETNSVMHVIQSHQLTIVDHQYDHNGGVLTIVLHPHMIESTASMLRNATRGHAEMTVGAHRTVIT